MTIKFDPEKPFGVVYGLSELFPGAKYQQGGFVFDIHRQCLNADKVDAKKTTPVEVATEALKKKCSAKADDAMNALAVAKRRLDEEGTQPAKLAYNKALKSYESAQDKLDSLSR